MSNQEVSRITTSWKTGGIPQLSERPHNPASAGNNYMRPALSAPKEEPLSKVILNDFRNKGLRANDKVLLAHESGHFLEGNLIEVCAEEGYALVMLRNNSLQEVPVSYNKSRGIFSDMILRDYV